MGVESGMQDFDKMMLVYGGVTNGNRVGGLNMDRMTAIQVFKEQLDHNDEYGICGDLADAFLMAYVALNEIQSVYNIGLTPERCAELAKAEQEGRLYVAPLENGTPIFIPASNWLDFDSSYEGKVVDVFEETYRHGFTEYQHGEIGKDWFITRAAAEKALESEAE